MLNVEVKYLQYKTEYFIIQFGHITIVDFCARIDINNLLRNPIRIIKAVVSQQPLNHYSFKFE